MILHADKSIQKNTGGAERRGISNLSPVGGKDWMKSTDRTGIGCCNTVASFFIYLDLYASSHHSQIQQISTWFGSSLPKSAHRPRYEFVRVLTWMVSHCRPFDPTWPIRHEHQCQCASMFQCSFPCNCPTWYSWFWTLNPEMRGALIQMFLYILLQVVVLCSTASLGLNANPACDWLRRIKMVYVFCFTGCFSSEASPQEPNEFGYWRPSAEHHRDHKATEPLLSRHVRTWSHIVTEEEF